MFIPHTSSCPTHGDLGHLLDVSESAQTNCLAPLGPPATNSGSQQLPRRHKLGDVHAPAPHTAPGEPRQQCQHLELNVEGLPNRETEGQETDATSSQEQHYGDRTEEPGLGPWNPQHPMMSHYGVQPVSPDPSAFPDVPL